MARAPDRKRHRNRSKVPSYKGLRPRSETTSRVARSSSKKLNTRCELLLQRSLRREGLRFKANVDSLPGRPDIVFPGERVVIFCDGDFWHGRSLRQRLKALASGHNAGYWVEKIRRNVARDRRHNRTLRAAGWRVVRVWEKDIIQGVDSVVARIIEILEH